MRTIIIGILFSVSFSCYSQQNIHEIFSNLKHGAILVRLESKQKTITALEKKNPSLAKKISVKQANRNAEIIDAFANHFNYCPVFFFYDYNSYKIKQKLFSEVLFDKNQKPITEFPDLSNNYLIAAFGETMGDSINLPAQLETYNKKGELISQKDTTHQTHEGIRFEALILLDSDLKILEDPNPHFVRQNVIIRKRKPFEMVLKMEKKITSHIKKINSN